MTAFFHSLYTIDRNSHVSFARKYPAQYRDVSASPPPLKRMHGNIILDRIVDTATLYIVIEFASWLRFVPYSGNFNVYFRRPRVVGRSYL